MDERGRDTGQNRKQGKQNIKVVVEMCKYKEEKMIKQEEHTSQQIRKKVRRMRK